MGMEVLLQKEPKNRRRPCHALQKGLPTGKKYFRTNSPVTVSDFKFLAISSALPIPTSWFLGNPGLGKLLPIPTLILGELMTVTDSDTGTDFNVLELDR